MGVETVALIGAGAVIGGALISSEAQKDAAKKANKPEPTVANPNFAPSQERYMQILDKYMSDHNIPYSANPQTGTVPGGEVPAVGAPAASPASRGIATKAGEAPPASSSTFSGSTIDAGIGGAATLGGALIQANAVKNAAGRNGGQPTVANPYYSQYQDKYHALLDNYDRAHGLPVTNWAPANGAVPPVAPDSTPPTPSGPPPRPKPAPRAEPSVPSGAVPQAAVRQVPASIDEPTYLPDDQYQNASLAATLGARRLGITQDQPELETTRDFFERDQKARQDQIARVYQYIYGQRTAI